MNYDDYSQGWDAGIKDFMRRLKAEIMERAESYPINSVARNALEDLVKDLEVR